MRAAVVIAVLGAAVLLAGAAVYDWGDEADAGAAASAGSVFAVRRGDLDITLVENGTLVAKESQKISSGADRSGRITFLIDEGTEVKEGDVLARLDATDLEDQVEELQLEISTAEVALFTAETELKIQEGDNAAAIEKADIALEKAKQEIDRYNAGDAPAERRKLEIAIKDLETDFSRAKKKVEDSQKLFEQTYINKSQLEEDQIDFERVGVQKDGAELDLEMFEEYTKPMTVTEREAAVRDAEREKANALLRSEANLKQRQVSVEESEKRLSVLKKDLEKTQEEIDKFTMEAPAPGIVLYGDPEERWSRDEIRLGGEIWGNLVLFTLPDLRVMQVNLQIHEADINKLAMGQKATVTMDTYTGLALSGTVTKVASVASSSDDWRRDQEVKKFDVSITLDADAQHNLKPGISAKAEIYIDSLVDVLYVPLQCVFLEKGEHSCYVRRAGGAIERVKVVPGSSNETYLQVKEGLAEGDVVLLYNPELPSGAAAGQEPEEDDEQEPASGSERGGRDGGRGPGHGTTP